MRSVRKTYYILFTLMMLCVACEWQLKPHNDDDALIPVSIERYDRVERLYLSTGDLAALQQMNTNYPTQTRMLLEDVLRIGKANDPEINLKFHHFFQDSTLQQLLVDVTHQYEDLSDIDSQLSEAFQRLRKVLPDIDIPIVYTQIGSFDQSIVVGHQMLGISLDKYLGSDYPFYHEHYTEAQRQWMTRGMIVPDCLSFYLLSLYPPSADSQGNPQERLRHMGRIQWVVNQLTDSAVFHGDHVEAVSRYMNGHPKVSIADLLDLRGGDAY